MLPLLLAAMIQCLAGDMGWNDAVVEYDTPLRLVAIRRADAKALLPRTKAHRFGAATVHAGTFDKPRPSYGEWQHRVLVLYLERGGRWWALRENGELPDLGDVRNLPKPVAVTRVAGKGLLQVEYRGEWQGANTMGVTTTTLLVEPGEQPRVRVKVNCVEFGGGGACGGPNNYHAPHRQLTCDEDLRCTSRESMIVGWTTRRASRTFDLLTNRTVPSSRFDAVTYANGAAFAKAFAADRDVVRNRVLIDGVGLVQPIYELSPNRILLAGPSREPLMTVRFFLLTPGTWKEIRLTRLADAGYAATPDKEEQRQWAGVLARDHLPDFPSLVFEAYHIEMHGRRRLIEVVATEGKGRGLFWIMVDPSGRVEALRVASDHPEYRNCKNKIYPPSATFLGLPNERFPAWIEAIGSWRTWDHGDKTLPKRCKLVGSIDWSAKSGWRVFLAEAPCTDPIPRPHASVIEDYGGLGCRLVEVEDP